MRDTATHSLRSRRRRPGSARLGWICGALVGLQITVVMLMPPPLRKVTAGLLTTVALVAAVVVAVEVGSKRGSRLPPGPGGARNSAGRPHSAGQRPKKPPAI
jgi:hypothetical protein